jgi:sulfide:quinone oxidoreductase
MWIETMHVVSVENRAARVRGDGGRGADAPHERSSMLTAARPRPNSTESGAPSPPLDAVICGGGVAALEAALALRELAGDRVAVTLVCPRPDFVLAPLAVGVPFAVAHVPHWPLTDVARELNARHIDAAVTHVDADAHRVHLSDGSTLGYDVLLLATGARRYPAFDRVQTFAAGDPGALHGLLQDLEEGWSKSAAFVVPPGVNWTLPAYELALLTARQVRSMGMAETQITIVTPEARPLALFGPRASAVTAGLLDRAGVAIVVDAYVQSVIPGRGLALAPGHHTFDVERVVALPRVEGLRISGLPHDQDGFLPVDEHASVIGVDDVFAAGDGTDFPVKQGGLATQQADAAAELIAQRAGAVLTPHPFRPVLRGWLLTGAASRFFANPIAGGAGPGVVSAEPLWSPPTKVSGRYLGPWLLAHGGEVEPATARSRAPARTGA